MNGSRHQRRPVGRGFTLVEVVVAMTIFSLIATSIFTIIFQAGMEAGDIRNMEARDQQISRFVTLLRESLEALPQDGSATLVNNEDAASGWPELNFSDTPTAFVFGINPGTAGETVIGLRPVTEIPPGLEDYDQALFTVALSREEFGMEENESGMMVRAGSDDLFLDEDQEGRLWLPLVENVTALGWRLWDADEMVWLDLDDWTKGETLPTLLEMTLADPYRPPLRVVFQIPDHATQPAEDTDDSDTSTTGTGSTNNTPRTSVAPAAGRGPGGGAQDGRGPRRGDGADRPRGPGGGKGGPGGGKGGPGGGKGGPGGGKGPGGGGARGPGGGGAPAGGGGGGPAGGGQR